MDCQNYRESQQFLRAPLIFPEQKNFYTRPAQYQLLQFVLNNSKKGNPADVINKIDEFCLNRWMMNLGPEKAMIVKKKAINHNIDKVLEIGGYCGYSALVFANQLKNRDNSKVYTIQINKNFAQIATKIHQHAGLSHKIHIHIGVVQNSLNFIQKNGPFDMIFIDHIKGLYLPDFKLIEANNGVKKSTVVVGDNIIYPGAPDYLNYFKNNSRYNSVLYHGYLQYSNQPDAVLVSIKN